MVELEWYSYVCKNGRVRLQAHGTDLSHGDVYINVGEEDQYHTVWLGTGIHRSYKNLDSAKASAKTLADKLIKLKRIVCTH